MLNISLQQKMMMKLSPQQVQYLKMLQLPMLALEQKIKAELELNPLLEEGYEEELEATQDQEDPLKDESTPDETTTEKASETKESEEDKYTIEDYMNDDSSGYKAREVFD
ncbi:MAG: RNA polymerase sigma-54 factor, partial [Bacteroidota bacterium]